MKARHIKRRHARFWRNLRQDYGLRVRFVRTAMQQAIHRCVCRAPYGKATASEVYVVAHRTLMQMERRGLTEPTKWSK